MKTIDHFRIQHLPSSPSEITSRCFQVSLKENPLSLYQWKSHYLSEFLGDFLTNRTWAISVYTLRYFHERARRMEEKHEKTQLHRSIERHWNFSTIEHDLLLKIIYLKQEREKQKGIYKVHEKSVWKCQIKESLVILFVAAEYDDKQIQIHWNMHFQYWILSRHCSSKRNFRLDLRGNECSFTSSSFCRWRARISSNFVCSRMRSDSRFFSSTRRCWNTLINSGFFGNNCPLESLGSFRFPKEFPYIFCRWINSRCSSFFELFCSELIEVLHGVKHVGVGKR